MVRIYDIVLVIVSCCILGGQCLPVYPPEDDSYLQILSAIENAKDNPDSYLGNLYDQVYDENYNDLSYQDYIDELMREQQLSREITGEALGNYYDMDEEEDQVQGPIDLEVEAHWPKDELVLGQVSGVAVCGQGYPHVFHRGERVWDQQMFDKDNNFIARDDGAIKAATVLKLSFEDGSILEKWGEDRFYMPHGITIDHKGNTWLTDVALHQVFKFEPGKNESSLTIGKAFQPAEDNYDKELLCKPTDVVVTSFGQIFVADGYCNSRVVKYDDEGNAIGQFGNDMFVIPHSLALAEELDLICVADREDMRILCFNAGIDDEDNLGVIERTYSEPEMGTIYGIEYNPETGLLHVVNGASEKERAIGFTIDLNQDSYATDVVDEWSPNNMGFDQPHDVAVSPDGNSVYVGEIGPNRIWKFENVAGDEVLAELQADADQSQEQEIEEIGNQPETVNESQENLEEQLEDEEKILSAPQDAAEVDSHEIDDQAEESVKELSDVEEIVNAEEREQAQKSASKMAEDVVEEAE